MLLHLWLHLLLLLLGVAVPAILGHLVVGDIIVV